MLNRSHRRRTHRVTVLLMRMQRAMRRKTCASSGQTAQRKMLNKGQSRDAFYDYYVRTILL